LARSEKYANSALELVKTAAKPRPDLPDEQWEAAKKDYTSQAHEALGLAAMARKKYPEAVTHFKAGVDVASTPDPATMVRLASAYNQSGKPDEAIALVDKIMAMPDLHPQIKQVAENEKANAMKRKASATPAGSASAPPPQVEIKKP